MLTVESLNFHHLRYFWCVVNEGGILPASRKLRVSHPTVSAQLRALEEELGVELFDRSQRRLQLTDAGRAAFVHAQKIFDLGRGLLESLRHGPEPVPLRLGVTDDLPKLFVRQLLDPILSTEARPRLVVEEERHTTLLARLGLRELDLVFADAPTPSHLGLASDDRELGGCGLSFLAAPRLARDLQGSFPASLEGAPFLAPPRESRTARSLTRWLESADVRPHVVAEVADSALLKTLGGDGLGVFVVPRVAEAPAVEQHGVEVVGRIDAPRVHYYATRIGRVGPTSSESEAWIDRLVDHARALLAGR